MMLPLEIFSFANIPHIFNESGLLLSFLVTVEIAKASLLVRAVDKTMKEGEKHPDFTVTYKGFVNGESVENLTKPAIAKLVEVGKGKIKKRKIVPSGSESRNYSFKYISGDLNVIRKRKSFFERN